MDPASAANGSGQWVDFVALGMVGVFFLWGLLRGFLQQLLGLLVLAGCLALSALLTPRFSAWIRETVWSQLSERVSKATAFVILLVVALGVSAFLMRLIREAFGHGKTSGLNRFLGGLLGAAKGTLLTMALVLVLVNLFNREDRAPPEFVRDILESRTAIATRWTAERVKGLLPEDLAPGFDKYARKLPAK